MSHTSIWSGHERGGAKAAASISEREAPEGWESVELVSSAADSRRSSLTTAASASGFTPDSVSPTSTVRVARSRPVWSNSEMSKRTAHARR